MNNEEKEGISLKGDEGGETESMAAGKRAEDIVKRYEKLAEANPESSAPPESSFVPGDPVGMEDDLSLAKKEKIGAIFAGDKKKLAGVLVVLALIAGVFAFWEPTEKPDADLLDNVITSENPNNIIIKSSLEKMRTMRAFSYDGKIDFVSKGQGTESSFAFTHDGVVQFDGDTPEFYTSFAFDRDRVDGMGTVKSKGDMEAVYLDKTFYAKVNDFIYDGGAAEGMEEVESYLNILEGSWYSVPDDTMDSFLGQFPEGETYANILSSSGIFSELGDIMRSHDLFEFKEDLGDDKVGEADTYHYLVRLDSAAAFGLALDIIKEGVRAQGDDKYKSFEEELKAKAEEVKKAEDLMDFVLSEVDVELWIGKSDSLLYRLKADGTFNEKFLSSYAEKKDALGEESEEQSEEVSGGESFDFNLDYTLSNFDTTAVRKPENAKDLDKALVVLEYQGMKEKSKNDPDQDGDGLSDKLETLYGSDPKKTDTDGDSYIDGDEVWNGYDPTLIGSARADYGKIYDSLVESLR
jgi:hypothetical protein